jgi:hypothetical protein
MEFLAPPGYETVEIDQRVPNVDPDLITRFKWRAERRCRKRNSERTIDSYRFEVCDWLDGRWAVVAMQNQLRPIENLDGLTWTCHICGESVLTLRSQSSVLKFIGEVPMQQNVRYCIDNQDCVKGAKTKDFMEKK